MIYLIIILYIIGAYVSFLLINQFLGVTELFLEKNINILSKSIFIFFMIVFWAFIFGYFLIRLIFRLIFKRQNKKDILYDKIKAANCSKAK